MRVRIKYLLSISIVFSIILTLFFFFTADYSNAKTAGGLGIGSTLLYFLIPNKKIKVDRKGNAIKKNK